MGMKYAEKNRFMSIRHFTEIKIANLIQRERIDIADFFRGLRYNTE